ncbi:MAG: TonB family protein [Pyrinomonadaceae bacterium]|nr:TonB family protein [Pyrinomonadaceae bacterium]
MRFVQINLAHASLLSFIFVVCPLAGVAGSPRTNIRAPEKPQPEAARTVFSQEAASGLAAYNQGDFEAAVKSLKQATQKRQDDATAWHFFALAYNQLGKQKEARKAMEKAVVLRLFRLTPGGLGKKVKPWDELSKEEKAERRREIAGRYREALTGVESYLQLNPPAANFWRQQHEALSLHVKSEETPEAEREVFQGNDEGIVKAKIQYRPEPMYTETARGNGTSGSVILRGLLGADGKVKQIIALLMLPDGLTEKAIEAMRKIKFTPATKDGRTVSQWVTVEYNFYVY